tara:strand:+ start:40 stop:414 length:375 start_codon:yes stop_codon:yes gene_type:complete
MEDSGKLGNVGRQIPQDIFTCGNDVSDSQYSCNSQANWGKCKTCGELRAECGTNTTDGNCKYMYHCDGHGDEVGAYSWMEETCCDRCGINHCNNKKRLDDGAYAVMPTYPDGSLVVMGCGDISS